VVTSRAVASRSSFLSVKGKEPKQDLILTRRSGGWFGQLTPSVPPRPGTARLAVKEPGAASK